MLYIYSIYKYIPCFAEPITHDSNNSRPTSRLSKTVDDPKNNVPIYAIELKPFAQDAEKEHASGRESHSDREHIAQVESIAEYTTDKKTLYFYNLKILYYE